MLASDSSLIWMTSFSMGLVKNDLFVFEMMALLFEKVSLVFVLPRCFVMERSEGEIEPF